MVVKIYTFLLKKLLVSKKMEKSIFFEHQKDKKWYLQTVAFAV